jgi:VIT1/CCC1 family predicted Fe2+/Mn2+ transporter
MAVGATGKSGALRAGIFGVNDGLVSNLSLIMGFAGAAVQNNVILLAGVAGLLAGAFSMGAGEYISMRVQRELFERLLHLEAHELATEPEEEHRELKAIYETKGFPSHLAEEVATVIMQDPEVALQTHAREELGLDPDELGSPWGAAAASFLAFTLGAAVPLIPFVVASGTAAAVAAVAASGVALFAVGATMSVITGRRAAWSGLRMLLIGGGAAAITFGVGRLLNVG